MQIVFKYGPVLLLLLWNGNILAQDFEFIKIQSAYYPKQAIEASSLDGKVGFWEWSGQVAIPQLFKNKKTILIHKLWYSNLRVETEGVFTNTAIQATKYYHSISYNLGLVKIVNSKWRLLVNLTPTLASDFTESLNDKDLLFQTSAMAMKTQSSQFKYGFGLIYTTRFGRQLVLPSGMIQYSTERMALNILLPNRLSVLFNTHQAVNFGMEATLDGGLFNNNSEIQLVNSIIDEAGYSRLNIGLTIALKLKEAIKINLTGGMAVGRRLDFIDIAEETLDRTPENGPFFRVGFSFSSKGKKVGAS